MPLLTTMGIIISPSTEFVIITPTDSLKKLRNVFVLLVNANQDVDRTNRSHFHRD